MKLILKLTALFTFLLFLNSCSSDDKPNISEPIPKKSSENYEPIGVINNEGLDFFLKRNNIDEIISKWNNNEIDHEGITELVLNEVNLFLDGNSFELNDKTVYLQKIKAEEYLRIFNNPQLGVFSETVAYIDNKDKMIEHINEIMSDYKKNPDSDDYEKVLATGELFKYSLEYWSVYNPELTQRGDCGDFNWLSVGVSDAQGAWGGFGIGGPWGAVGFGLMMSAHNMVIQAIWNCA